MSGRFRLAIVGASGRMGRAIARIAIDEAAKNHEGAEIVFAYGAHETGADIGVLAGRSALGVAVTSSFAGLAAAKADVVIDFSSADICANVANAAATAGAALVSGTTGIGDDARAAFARASERVAVLWEANMSVGVHVLAGLVEEAARRLGPSFHAEIVEVHHAAKVDSPSGTALLLARALEAGRHADRPLDVENGRVGKAGPRKADALGMHAVRGGDVIGDHTVHLLGQGERLELTHRATDRDVFARGALRAATALAFRPAGRYSLRDVLLNE